jgi:hypothetical protein
MRGLRAVAGIVGIVCSLTAGRAFAGDEQVTLRLKNGGAVRGELVESVPGEKVVLKLATGEVRSVPWADIESPEAAGRPTPTASPASTDAGVVPDARAVSGAHARGDVAPAAPPTVHVSLTSEDQGVKLEMLLGTSTGTASFGTRSASVSLEHYRYICTLPCSKNVDPAERYRVDGPTIVPSGLFEIPDHAQLTVKGGSLVARWAGATTLVIGASYGVPAVIFGALLTAADKPDSAGTGHIVLGTGIASLLALVPLGVALLVASGTDVVDDGSGKTIAAAKKKPGPRLLPSGVVSF